MGVVYWWDRSEKPSYQLGSALRDQERRRRLRPRLRNHPYHSAGSQLPDSAPAGS